MSISKLTKDQIIRILLNYEVTGLLKGYDQLLNLVMDEVEEIMRGQLHLLS